MSKTISIPEYNNPFIVNINNKEYIYKAGATIEVPDEVAEAIEDALELVPKPKRYLSDIARIAEQSITEITAEDLAGISSISVCAFYSCKSLTKVILPDAIKTIGNNAFDWCEELKEIYLPETPPTITNANAFGTINMPDRKFYCKSQESLDAYKAIPLWSDVAGLANFIVKQ